MATLNKRKRCYSEFNESSPPTTYSVAAPFTHPAPKLSAPQDNHEDITPNKLSKQEETLNLDDLEMCVRRVVKFIANNIMQLPVAPSKFATIVSKLCQYTTQLDISVVFYQLLLNGLITPVDSSSRLYVVPPVLRPWHEVVIWVPSDPTLTSSSSTSISEDFRRGFVSCYDFLRTKVSIGIPFTVEQLYAALAPHCQIQHGCDTNVVLEALLRREVIWLEKTEPELLDSVGSPFSVRYNPSAPKLLSTDPVVHFPGKESSLSVN